MLYNKYIGDQKMEKNWCVGNNASDMQGLVIDENTGENIAVTYKTENAPLVAIAPEAVELLAEILDTLNNMTTNDFSIGKDRPIRHKIYNLLDRINYEEK